MQILNKFLNVGMFLWQSLFWIIHHALTSKQIHHLQLKTFLDHTQFYLNKILVENLIKIPNNE